MRLNVKFLASSERSIFVVHCMYLSTNIEHHVLNANPNIDYTRQANHAFRIVLRTDALTTALGLPHEAAFLPGKGSKRTRVTAAQGYSVGAVRNRIQVDMDAHVARCMLQAWSNDRGDEAERRLTARRLTERRPAARAARRR